jgi:hypothetical protein
MEIADVPTLRGNTLCPAAGTAAQSQYGILNCFAAVMYLSLTVPAG